MLVSPREDRTGPQLFRGYLCLYIAAYSSTLPKHSPDAVYLMVTVPIVVLFGRCTYDRDPISLVDKTGMP